MTGGGKRPKPIEIFHCSSCSQPLDYAASRILRRYINRIRRRYTGMVGYECAQGYHDNLRFFVVLLPMICKCGFPGRAIFHTRFMLDPPDPPTFKELRLVHIEPGFFGPLEGIRYGGVIRVSLERLLVRWRYLALHTIHVHAFHWGFLD